MDVELAAHEDAPLELAQGGFRVAQVVVRHEDEGARARRRVERAHGPVDLDVSERGGEEGDRARVRKSVSGRALVRVVPRAAPKSTSPSSPASPPPPLSSLEKPTSSKLRSSSSVTEGLMFRTNRVREGCSPKGWLSRGARPDAAAVLAREPGAWSGIDIGEGGAPAPSMPAGGVSRNEGAGALPSCGGA